MIEKLDIANFGSFDGFQWDTNVREPQGAVGRFQKLNIIYGRNYSGKTTLSRILRSFEVGQIPARYDNPSFQIKTANGQWTQAQLSVQGPPIRVYNKDFVEANLAFLRDDQGHIQPFAVLGAQNKEVEQEIEKVRALLGSKDSDTGLRGAFFKKQTEEANARTVVAQKTEALNKKLFEKANGKPGGIKHNTLYNNPYYDVRNLNADIARVQSHKIAALDEATRVESIARLTEKPLKDIGPLATFTSSLSALNQRAVAIAAEKIQPSAPLQDLLASAVLANWVRDGRSLHVNRDCCAFCRQPLPADLTETLDKHFSEESEKLQDRIQRFLQDCESERARVRSLTLPEQGRFYSSFHAKRDEAEERLDSAKKAYERALDALAKVARERSENIFSAHELTEAVPDSDSGIEAALNEGNELIRLSNEHTIQIGANQKQLRDELRLSEVAAFMTAIGLDEAKADIDQHQRKFEALTKEREALEVEGKKLRVTLEALQAQLRDEKRGAERVNGYLNHSLGGTSLRLLAEEEEGKATYRFRIMRGEQEAFNLSEGECSLVAFCYYLARLDDVQTHGTKPIIYIDDPISSLDSNHIFFIFSLIESFIARPLVGSDGTDLKDAAGKPVHRYEQLFISTHNLDFLKYLKRLTPPEQVGKFLISRTATSSSISIMPRYLKSYITELNYLFAEIHTCTDDANSAASYHSFYNFGNNLRKFLEAFLFFKYPSATVTNDKRLRLFFGHDTSAVAFVTRLTNEHSHLEEFVDRGMVPIDCAEIARTAKFVLAAMKAKDLDQYQHFLSSINAADPLPA
ncbi:AAA family ATPase [Uliginosibacterium sp. sgz301328]|uniref:AAA family ATPase n=1 Tax=Uliginosibacterium sp. sgz301328 TaxID=3243764 RepID=UPI00359EE41A